MCPHDKFGVVFYEDGIFIRECLSCHQREIRIDYDFVNINELEEAIGRVSCMTRLEGKTK